LNYLWLSDPTPSGDFWALFMFALQMEATRLMIERNLLSKSEISKKFDIISEQLKRLTEECRINAPKVDEKNLIMIFLIFLL
jgi:hypothetical protein